MKNQLTPITLSMLALTYLPNALAIPPEPAEGKRWAINYFFSDEFNGDSLDSFKWRDYHSRWEGRPPAKFDPSTVSVKDGTLQIKNKPLATPDRNYTMAGGAVQSLKETAYHGYYEARFKASRINMSTTFWLSNPAVDVTGSNNLNADCNNDTWSMELDIAEAVGGEIDVSWGEKMRNSQQYNTHIFYQDCNGERTGYSRGTNVAEGSGSEAINNTLPDGEEVWENYNTYAAWWKNENQIDFYFNNQFSGTVEVSTDLHDKPFSRPMHMQMVTETYDWAKPYPSVAELENDQINTSYYDWVRSYVLVDVKQNIAEPDLSLLSNKGFETGDFQGWVGWGGNPREVVNTQSHSGDYAAHLVGGGAVERAISLKTHTEYLLTAELKLLKGEVNIGIKTNDAAGTGVAPTQVESTASDEYKTIEYRFTTADNGNLKFYFWAKAGAEYYLDDLSLTQINPEPEHATPKVEDIFVEQLAIKKADIEQDKLNIAFIYQSDIDREVDIVITDGETQVTQQRVVIKAGYGHQAESLDIPSVEQLQNPMVSLTMYDKDQHQSLASSESKSLGTATPAKVTAKLIPTEQTEFVQGSGEKQILVFTLTANTQYTEFSEITLAHLGDEVKAAEDIESVNFYFDANNDGQAQPNEQLMTASYPQHNGDLTLSLAEPLVLQKGDNQFLINYAL